MRQVKPQDLQPARWTQQGKFSRLHARHPILLTAKAQPPPVCRVPVTRVFCLGIATYDHGSGLKGQNSYMLTFSMSMFLWAVFVRGSVMRSVNRLSSLLISSSLAVLAACGGGGNHI